MCEIFGFSSRDDFTANNFLKEFFSHSKKHPHGWGLACISRENALIEKESVKAIDSNYIISADKCKNHACTYQICNYRQCRI